MKEIVVGVRGPEVEVGLEVAPSLKETLNAWVLWSGHASVGRGVQILGVQILARPISVFWKTPGSTWFEKKLITGTRSEIESLKKRDTCCKHYYKLFDIFDCCFVFLQMHIGNVFHYAWFQLNWTNCYLEYWCIWLRLWKFVGEGSYNPYSKRRF